MADTTPPSISLRALQRRGAPERIRGRRCAVERTATALPTGERTALHALLADRAWSAVALADALAAAGHPAITRGVIYRHRAGLCECEAGA